MATLKDVTFESASKYGWGLILIHPDKLKLFLERLFKEKGSVRILDVGCFKGMLKGWIEQNFPLDKYKWDYVGIDIVEPPDRRKDYPHYIMNAQALEFPPNSFDAVVMLEVLEHVVDYTMALREAYRVLTPGGGIFIQSVHACDPNAILDEQHFHVLRPETLKRLLQFLGFKDCESADGGNMAVWCYKR